MASSNDTAAKVVPQLDNQTEMQRVCLNNRLSEASLILDRAQAVIDLIYTIACEDKIESLGDKTLASALDDALQLVTSAKDIVDSAEVAA
jgi:hypothetical protein